MVEGGGGGGGVPQIPCYPPPPPSNKPSLFRESKLISPPPLPLIIIHWWIDFINQLQCMTVKLCMDWSRMFLSLGCKTSNHCPWALLLCILASFLWIKSDTIVFAKFINKSSLSSKPPSKVFEINKARGGGGGGGGVVLIYGIWNGRDFTSWSIWKGREFRHFGPWKGLKA